MPFFEKSSHFQINGGNFTEFNGNQNECHYGQSVNSNGQDNSVVYNNGGPQYGGDHNQIISHGGSVSGITMGRNGMIYQDQNSMPARRPGANEDNPINVEKKRDNHHSPASYGGDHNQIINHDGSVLGITMGRNGTIARDPNPPSAKDAVEIIEEVLQPEDNFTSAIPEEKGKMKKQRKMKKTNKIGKVIVVRITLNSLLALFRKSRKEVTQAALG